MPKVVDHEKYRDELLHRYFDLFARRGYLDVTMREIAKELGVSTGTLYHYFPTKKDLLEQLFQLASRRDSSNVLSQFNDSTPLEDRLQAFIQYVKDKEIHFQDIVLLTVDFYRFRDSDDWLDASKEVDRFYRETFVEGLQLEPELAMIPVLFLNGMVYHRLVFPDSIPFDDIADNFKQMFVEYVEKRKERGGET